VSARLYQPGQAVAAVGGAQVGLLLVVKRHEQLGAQGAHGVAAQVEIEGKS